MKAIVVLIVIAAILSGCTSTKVWTRKWSLDSGNRIAEISKNTAEHSARIELKDGTVFNARSIQITPDLSSGILSDGSTRSWQTEMTSQIFYERRSTKKTGLGFVIGVAVGATYGLLRGDTTSQSGCGLFGDLPCEIPREQNAFLGGLVGGLIGAAIGKLTGKSGLKINYAYVHSTDSSREDLLRPAKK